MRELFRSVLGSSCRIPAYALRRRPWSATVQTSRTCACPGTGQRRRSDAGGSNSKCFAARPTTRAGWRPSRCRGATISRKEIDDYTSYVVHFRCRGLAWIKVNDIDAGVAGLQVAHSQVHAGRRWSPG